MLLNWMYRWSLHTVYGNQKSKQIFFFMFGKCKQFWEPFHMNDVLFDKEYLYLRNELLFYLICVSYCQTKGAESLLFLVIRYAKKEKKQTGSKWVYKKDTTPNVQLQNYNNTKVHHKGGQIMRQLEKYTIKYKDCASNNLKAAKIYWFISTHLYSALRIWQSSARSATFKRNKVSGTGEQCLSKTSTASRNQNTHTQNGVRCIIYVVHEQVNQHLVCVWPCSSGSV